MSNERNNGLLGFLAGIAAGAVLGILFAPQSGKETRDAIRRKSRDAKDKLDEMIDEGHEKWSDMKGKASDAASMTRDEVDDFVRFMFKEGKYLWERVSDDASDAGKRMAREAKNAADDLRKSAN